MSHEIRLAFEHPAARASATAPDGPLDRISVRDHVVAVEIGAFQAERGTTQRICFNIVVEVRPMADALDDDVDRILSYDRVTEAISAARSRIISAVRSVGVPPPQCRRDRLTPLGSVSLSKASSALRTSR